MPPLLVAYRSSSSSASRSPSRSSSASDQDRRTASKAADGDNKAPRAASPAANGASAMEIDEKGAKVRHDTMHGGSAHSESADACNRYCCLQLLAPLQLRVCRLSMLLYARALSRHCARWCAWQRHTA